MRRIVFMLPLVLIGCSSRPSDPAKKDSQILPGDQPAPDVPVDLPPPKRTRLGEIADINGMHFVLTRAAIEKVTFKKVFDDNTTESDQPYLVLTIRVSNTSDTRKLDYNPSLFSPPFGNEGAKVSDEFGNAYSLRTQGVVNDVVGAVRVLATLYPGKSATDIVLFEVPVAKAKHLYIDLPAASVGEKGMYRFELGLPLDPKDK